MKQIKPSKASLIRPVIVLPKASCGAHLDTPEKRQAFYKLQDEIWRAFLKALEEPIRQLHTKQHRIVEVLGTIRFYINHNTGEIDLRVRARPGNTEAAFERGRRASYSLDLPLNDINLVVEAFITSWNQELILADSSYNLNTPNQNTQLQALFNGMETVYYRLITSISKAVQKTVLWHNLRHQVRDALEIDPELMRIARRAKAVRKVELQTNHDIEHFNNVIQYINGYRQLDKEAPNLLWLYTIALEEKVIPKGELVQALKKMLVYCSGCRERGWRLVCSSNIRDFEPALETNGDQWDLLVEYIKLHNLLDRNQAIPRKALHLFNEPYWKVNNKNKIVYRGVEVKPVLLNSYINAVINTENIEEFSLSEAVAVFTWLFDAKPQLDKNQLKKGWPWLFKEATKWLEDNATEAQLTAIQWECKLGAVTLGQYQFVPLINAWQVRQEALRNRHCADQYIENCRAGTYRLYSVYYNNKHRATLGVEFENRRWEVHQIKSFANQSVSIQLWSIADSFSEGLNLVNEGFDDRVVSVKSERDCIVEDQVQDTDTDTDIISEGLNSYEATKLSVEVSREALQLAEQFWDDEGVPLLRLPKAGERVFILGWSLGQDKEVLLSREVGEDEDYGEAASEAAGIVDSYFSDTFTCDGEVVAKLSAGFYDGYCDWYSEITFDESWHVTLLQEWLDSQGAQICIRPSKELEENQIILEHVERATYTFDRSIKYAAFKDMSIQNSIKKFVSEYWQNNHDLPIGKYDINGTDVTFM